MRIPKVKPRNAEERRSLKAALEEMRRENRFAPGVGLKRLLTRWTWFVDDVEAGYPLSIWDYQSDLMIRDALAEIMASTPPRFAAELLSVVGPLDDRFRAASRPSQPLMSGPECSGFWWSRLPLRLEGELLEGVRAEGLY